MILVNMKRLIVVELAGLEVNIFIIVMMENTIVKTKKWNVVRIAYLMMMKMSCFARGRNYRCNY